MQSSVTGWFHAPVSRHISSMSLSFLMYPRSHVNEHTDPAMREQSGETLPYWMGSLQCFDRFGAETINDVILCNEQRNSVVL